MTARHRRPESEPPQQPDLHAGSAGFAVLFVGAGNVLRSPIAERLFTARLPAHLGAEVSVTSAGTRALVGRPMDPLAGLVLRELGGNPNGHAARQLEPAIARRASLILTATSSQRDTIVQVDRSVLRRTFTMREFARLGRELPRRRPAPAGLRLVGRVRQIAERRAGVASPGSSIDEIADPLGAPLEVIRFRGAQVSAAVDGVLDALGVQPVTDRPSPRHGGPLTVEQVRIDDGQSGRLKS